MSLQTADLITSEVKDPSFFNYEAPPPAYHTLFPSAEPHHAIHAILDDTRELSQPESELCDDTSINFTAPTRVLHVYGDVLSMSEALITLGDKSSVLFHVKNFWRQRYLDASSDLQFRRCSAQGSLVAKIKFKQGSWGLSCVDIFLPETASALRMNPDRMVATNRHRVSYAGRHYTWKTTCSGVPGGPVGQFFGIGGGANFVCVDDSNEERPIAAFVSSRHKSVAKIGKFYLLEHEGLEAGLAEMLVITGLSLMEKRRRRP